MKTIKTITLSVVLLLSASSANAGIFDSHTITPAVEAAAQVMQTGVENLQNITASTFEKAAKATDAGFVETKRILGQAGEFTEAGLTEAKRAYDYSMQLFTRANFEKLVVAAKQKGMTIYQNVEHYGKDQIAKLPEWAQQILNDERIFNAKNTKVAAVVTAAAITGGVVYKYDLHKKAYNRLVVLKNKVFGKNETK